MPRAATPATPRFTAPFLLVHALLWSTTAAMAIGPIVVALKDINAYHCPWISSASAVMQISPVAGSFRPQTSGAAFRVATPRPASR
jgi:hypothetical protein